MTEKITVIGAGLAGSEAAWQLAEQKIPVRLIEMRPKIRCLFNFSSSII